MRRILLTAALVTALLGFGPLPDALGAGGCASNHKWDTERGPLHDQSPGEPAYAPSYTQGSDGLPIIESPVDPYETDAVYHGGGTFSADVVLDAGVRACRELQYGVTVYEWSDADEDNAVDAAELGAVMLDAAVRGGGEHVEPPVSYESDGDRVTIVTDAPISSDYVERCVVAVARVTGAGHHYETGFATACGGSGGQFWT